MDQGLEKQFMYNEKNMLNITGFIQPVYIVKMMALDDFDGFNDQQLFICPKERDVDY